MAANTVGSWTTKTILGKTVSTCTVTVDAANGCAWTNVVPSAIDPGKRMTLIVEASAAQDGAAAPLALYVGYNSSFALSGTGAGATVANGAKFKNLTDDLGYAAAAVMAFDLDPASALADVVTVAAVGSGMKSKIPVAPYIAFSLNAASGTLLAHTLTFTIIQ